MAIEFIGMIGVRPEGADGAAVHVIGGAIDAAWMGEFAHAHEDGGFDRVLIGYGRPARASRWPPTPPPAPSGSAFDRPPAGICRPTLAARKAPRSTTSPADGSRCT